MPSPSLLISPQGSLTPSPRPYSPQGQIPFTCDPPQGRMSLLCDPLSRGRMPLLCDPLPHRRRPYTRAFITCGSMTSPLTSVTSDARHCSSSPPQITPNLSLTSGLSLEEGLIPGSQCWVALLAVLFLGPSMARSTVSHLLWKAGVSRLYAK